MQLLTPALVLNLDALPVLEISTLWNTLSQFSAARQKGISHPHKAGGTEQEGKMVTTASPGPGAGSPLLIVSVYVHVSR